MDKNGLVTLTTWNARGLPESTTTAAQAQCKPELPSTDANGNTATHDYDLLNRKVKTAWQDGSTAYNAVCMG